MLETVTASYVSNKIQMNCKGKGKGKGSVTIREKAIQIKFCPKPPSAELKEHSNNAHGKKTLTEI